MRSSKNLGGKAEGHKSTVLPQLKCERSRVSDPLDDADGLNID